MVGVNSISNFWRWRQLNPGVTYTGYSKVKPRKLEGDEYKDKSTVFPRWQTSGELIRPAMCGSGQLRAGLGVGILGSALIQLLAD